MEACLEAKVPCLDFDDDVEGTQAALDMSERAKKAGVAFFIGGGASPGMNNILVVDAARCLDRVTSIELFWLVSNRSREGRHGASHAYCLRSLPDVGQWQTCPHRIISGNQICANNRVRRNDAS